MPIRFQVEALQHPVGSTPAHMLIEEYRRSKTAGVIGYMNNVNNTKLE